MSFPNIKHFSSAGDCFFDDLPSPGRWIPETIELLALGRTTQKVIELSHAKNLCYLGLSPRPQVSSPLHEEVEVYLLSPTVDIRVNLNHCHGHVDVHTKGFSKLELVGRHPKSSVAVYAPKESRGTIDVNDFFVLLNE